MTRPRKTPYQRIVAAAKAGKSLRLSVEDCFELYKDPAIEQVAVNDNEDEEARKLMPLKSKARK